MYLYCFQLVALKNKSIEAQLWRVHLQKQVLKMNKPTSLSYIPLRAQWKTWLKKNWNILSEEPNIKLIDIRWIGHKKQFWMYIFSVQIKFSSLVLGRHFTDILDISKPEQNRFWDVKNKQKKQPGLL